MAQRTRNDKKIRKEMRLFFRSKHGQELTHLTKQNGKLKLAAAGGVLLAIAEAIIIGIIIIGG